MPKFMLTIAIPTWHNLRQCLDTVISMYRNTNLAAKIVIVNNGAARDRRGVAFEEQFFRLAPYLQPHVKILQADRNLGWMGGINLAFEKECDTPIFCMMNDDLVFIADPQFWLRLLTPFSFPEVGAVGPSSNFVMGCQSIFDHSTPTIVETTLLIGFLMAVRSDLFAEIGGLDENLPGGDDLDLSIMIRKRKFKLIAQKGCYVHHIGCQTGERLEPGEWNSPDKNEMRTMCLIAKHGFREWYDCAASKHRQWETICASDEEHNPEKEALLSYVDGLSKGLDLGCGARKIREDAIGVDLQASGEFGMIGCRKGTISVADVQADAQDMPMFADGSKDFIIASHIFEHLIDIDRALREWHRVLRPGGVLALACPDENQIQTMLMDPSHVHAWTADALSAVLVRWGFRVEDRQKWVMNFTLKAVKEGA